MFDRLKQVIVASAALVAIIPGASLVGGFVELPIQFDKFIGLLASITGPIIFFLFYICKNAISELPKIIIVPLIAIFIIGGISSAYWLYEYTDNHIYEYPYYDHANKLQNARFIMPDEFGPDLDKIVNEENLGSLESAMKRDREGTLRLLATDAKSVRRKMAVGFLFTQAMFIFGFLMAAWATVASGTEGRPDE